jgi:hypothetical protein
MPPGPFEEAVAPSARTPQVAGGLPDQPELLVESEAVAEVEPLVEPVVAKAPVEAVVAFVEAGPQPPLASPTLGELYFNQGFTDKALEVYRQLLEREPGNERVRARLVEIEALDRHLRAEELRGAPARAEAASAPPRAPQADPRGRRREAVERTIARLQGFLAAVRKG